MYYTVCNNHGECKNDKIKYYICTSISIGTILMCDILYVVTFSLSFSTYFSCSSVSSICISFVVRDSKMREREREQIND